MTTVTFTRVFAAAHRVWNDPGKCSNIHGHNYRAEVSIDLFDGELDEQGFVAPFDAIKGIIDDYDHALILDNYDPLISRAGFSHVMGDLNIRYMQGTPSTERFAKVLADRIKESVSETRDEESFLIQVRVSLRETDGIEAWARSE